MGPKLHRIENSGYAFSVPCKKEKRSREHNIVSDVVNVSVSVFGYGACFITLSSVHFTCCFFHILLCSCGTVHFALMLTDFTEGLIGLAG